VYAAFLPKSAGNLEPHVIGRHWVTERRCDIPDLPEVGGECPAGIAGFEVLLELRGADPSERAVKQRLNLVD
jgi:hypothetical protein